MNTYYKSLKIQEMNLNSPPTLKCTNLRLSKQAFSYSQYTFPGITGSGG